MQYNNIETYLKGGENMNVNINNLVIGKRPDNIIRSNSSSIKKGMFASMLENAITENQDILLLGDDFSNLLISKDSSEGYVNFEGFEDNEETYNHIGYENIIGLTDIFFFRPDMVKDEVLSDNLVFNVDYDVFKNQYHSKSIENIKSPQENQETDLITSQPNVAVKLTPDGNLEINKDIIDNEKQQIEVQSGKLKNEHTEISMIDSTLVKNKIITVSDESTEIKSQVLSQVKDKIIIIAEKGHEVDSIKTITMQLQPQNLGKVDIKLIYENNKLIVEIKALYEETQKILSSNTGKLHDLLSKSSKSDVEIIMKPYEFELKQQPIHQNSAQGYEQNFYQNNDQNHGQQGRQRNKYYHDNIKRNEEDIFSELIDLSNLKIKEGIYGN